jgi:hypothetical protein
MKTSVGLLACLPGNVLQAMVDAGALDRTEIVAIKALRGSGVSKRRMMSHAPEPEISKTTTAHDLVAERVAEAADIQKGLRESIRDVQAASPGMTRSDAIDKVLYGRGVREMVGLEKRIDDTVSKLGGGALPQHRATTDINFSTPGVHGRTGYDSGVADTHPKNQAAGENPIIRDHHELLDDIKSGKVLRNDPKVSALVALERKQIFEQND